MLRCADASDRLERQDLSDESRAWSEEYFETHFLISAAAKCFDQYNRRCIEEHTIILKGSQSQKIR